MSDNEALIERLRKYRGGDISYRALMDEAIVALGAAAQARDDALEEAANTKQPTVSRHPLSQPQQGEG